MVTEKECLTDIISVTKFRNYLEGKDFTVISDHQALYALKKAKNKLARLHKWAAILSIFHYRIEYLKGSQHPPDCLSRPAEWKNKELSKEGDEDNLLHEDDLLDCLLVYSQYQPQIDISKDREEEKINYALRRDSIWYLINQLRYKDHRFGHFGVLLQELNTDLANPDMQDIQSKDFMFEYIKNGLITKNKLMMRKFCMINDVVCRQASKKNPNLRIIIP